MKYLRQKEKKPGKVILLVVCIVAVLALVAGLAWWLGSRDSTPANPGGDEVLEQNGTEQTEASTGASETGGSTEPTVAELSLPYALEDGKLTVDTLFQFSGLNPDRQDEEAENVAAIQLTNTSQEHLAVVNITVTTTDGTTAAFTAYDIPSGMSAMVICTDNTVISNGAACAQITCDAVFASESPLAADKLAISVEGTEITVENISGEDLAQITVYCHSMLDESSYGGITYPYVIDSLPAGESTVVNAWECILGLAKVVRVEIG